MTTPDYTQKMSELRAKVGQYAKLPNQSKSGFASVAKSIITINTRYPFFYAVPPVIIIVIFIFMKPSFICNDNIDVDNVITKKINFNKLFIYGLIIGGVISIGLFVYFKQKK